MFFPPFIIFFIFFFVFLLLVVFGLIQFGLFTWAFSKIGIPPEYPFSRLFLCIIGSMINIPLRRIPLDDNMDEWQTVSFFGMRFRPPRMSRPNEMVLAINVGGAVIPAILSLHPATSIEDYTCRIPECQHKEQSIMRGLESGLPATGVGDRG